MSRVTKQDWLKQIGVSLHTLDIIQRLNDYILRNSEACKKKQEQKNEDETTWWFDTKTSTEVPMDIDVKQVKRALENVRDNVKGIGQWTVDNTLLVSMIDWDAFPLGDYFIKKRVQKLISALSNAA